MKHTKFLVPFLVSFLLFLISYSSFNSVKADEEDLMNCLCVSACWDAGWDCSSVSCSYDPNGTGDDLCSDVGEGECLCSGFGCGRAPLPAEGDNDNTCLDEYGPVEYGDGKCEIYKGEDCSNSEEDCACEDGNICNPSDYWGDQNGCSEEPSCPDGAAISTITGECQCQRANYLLTEDGCIAECPTGSFYSENQQECICKKIGYEIVGDSCIPSDYCPENSTINDEQRCICDDNYVPNIDDTACVRDLSDAAKLKIIMDRYEKEIPKGLVGGGTYNNALSFWDNKYSEFACGGYQSKVLKFLDTIKFSSDPEERALLDNFDYGPIQAYFGGHQAVALYPKSSNWMDDGIVLDPWPNQKPESVTIQGWAQNFSLVDPLHSGTYYGISGSSLYEQNAPNYPTVGGTYKNPLGSKILSEKKKEVFANFTDGEKNEFKSLSKDVQDEYINRKLNEGKIRVYLYSPVSVLVEDIDGNLSGETETKLVNEIDDILMAKVKEETGNYATFIELPSSDYNLALTGTDSGEVTMLTRIIDEDGYYHVQTSTFDIDEDQELLLEIAYDDNLVTLTSDGIGLELAEVSSTDDITEPPDVAEWDTIDDIETWAEENWEDALESSRDSTEREDIDAGETGKFIYEIDAKALAKTKKEGKSNNTPILIGAGVVVLLVIGGIIFGKVKSSKPKAIQTNPSLDLKTEIDNKTKEVVTDTKTNTVVKDKAEKNKTAAK